MFQAHKTALLPYTKDQLDFPGITVESIEILSADQKNIFKTYWDKSSLNVAKGLDFLDDGDVFIKFVFFKTLISCY